MRLESIQNAIATLGEAQAASGPGLADTIERLEKSLSRAGKELFKASASAESQQKTSEAMLEQVRSEAAHRERELAQMRERLSEAAGAGRLEVINRLLPALDGLEEALASGRRLVQRAKETEASGGDKSFWSRFNPAKRAELAAESSSMRAISAWLDGLAFVHERLLEALAVHGVSPIPTEGEMFDPVRHLALESVPATNGLAPGAIVQEHRRGYVRGDIVLRYAEVAVARAVGELS